MPSGKLGASASALQCSIKNGEIAEGVDTDDMSEALVTAVMGIHTANRVSGSNKAGAPLARMIRQQIESWRLA
jgi:hypothetical protein